MVLSLRKRILSYNEPYERNTMFKNHEFRVRVAKRADQDTPHEELRPIIDPDDLKVAVDLMKKAALLVSGVYLVGKIVDAGCEITVHHATK